MSNPEQAKTGSDLLVSASAHVVGVLAEALAPHAFPIFDIERGCWDCPCGEPVPRSSNGWEKHVASVVAALPNIAIVKLPEPAFQEDGAWEWCSGRSRNAVWINDDGLIEDRFGIGQEPEDVRMWAADLLAAAARAAGGQA